MRLSGIVPSLFAVLAVHQLHQLTPLLLAWRDLQMQITCAGNEKQCNSAAVMEALRNIFFVKMLVTSQFCIRKCSSRSKRHTLLVQQYSLTFVRKSKRGWINYFSFISVVTEPGALLLINSHLHCCIFLFFFIFFSKEPWVWFPALATHLLYDAG